MICGFCGFEFDEHAAKQGCHSCPGGCRNVHCPRCNYKNPRKTGLEKKLESFFGKKPSGAAT